MGPLRKTASVATLAMLALGACGDDEKSSDPTTAAVGDGELSVSGTVRRKIDPSEKGDGKGTLHVSIAAQCRNTEGTLDNLGGLGGVIIKDVDLSNGDSSQKFSLTGLEPGTYYVAAWFDDVVNKDQDEDLPGIGDLAMFGKLSPRCEQVVLDDEDVEGVKLEFDYEMLFNLTGLSGDAGVIESGGDEDNIDPSDIKDDGKTYTVTVRLSRTVAPSLGGDGTGPFFSGLIEGEVCFDGATGNVPVPAFPVLLDEVSLPEDDSTFDIVIEDVPNGVYVFNGFIDDVANADAKDPSPGVGDLVRFGGGGPACEPVIVNGRDVTVEFPFNFVMPFDF